MDVRADEVRVLCIGCSLCQSFMSPCECDDTAFCVGKVPCHRIPFVVLREFLCLALATWTHDVRVQAIRIQSSRPM